MSASRKKQERKAAEETVITSRAQEAAEKEAKRKRNTLIYTIIGVVVVILVAILLIWNSGIIQRNTKVAEINGEKVTASQVAYYYYSNDVMYTANLYSRPLRQKLLRSTAFPKTTSISLSMIISSTAL